VARLTLPIADYVDRYGPHVSDSPVHGWAHKPPVEKLVNTHCCFCGMQCGIKLQVAGNQVVGFEPWEEFPFNEGRLCPKGATALQLAVSNRRAESVLYRAARVYVNSGHRTKATPLLAQLSEKLQPDSRAYAKVLEGEMFLVEKKSREAIDRLKDAQKVADTWLGHLTLGRAYLAAGAFPEASSEFDICLRRRGEATAAFLDDRPTYHLLPQVWYYQARAQEELKNAGAVDQYKAFLAIKQKADKDPLVEDARKRVK